MKPMTAADRAEIVQQLNKVYDLAKQFSLVDLDEVGLLEVIVAIKRTMVNDGCYNWLGYPHTGETNTAKPKAIPFS